MKQLIFIIIAIGSFSLTGFSQTFKAFNGEENFLVELEQQIVDKSVEDAKKDHKDLIEKFTEMWTELNSFTPAQKNTINKTSNDLLTARLKVIPDVRDYIKTIIIVIEQIM